MSLPYYSQAVNDENSTGSDHLFAVWGVMGLWNEIQLNKTYYGTLSPNFNEYLNDTFDPYTLSGDSGHYMLFFSGSASNMGLTRNPILNWAGGMYPGFSFNLYGSSQSQIIIESSITDYQSGERVIEFNASGPFKVVVGVGWDGFGVSTTAGFGYGIVAIKIIDQNIIGTDFDDVLIGDRGNDTLFGGLGSDVLDGGLGSNTVVYAGNRSDYRVSLSGPYYIVQDIRINGNEGIDNVTNVDYFQFADNSYPISSFDFISPEINGFNPTNGSLNAPVNSNLTVTFSEAIQIGIGLIVVHSGSLIGPIVESFNVSSSNRLAVTDNSLTIDLTENLANSTQYFVTFDSGSVKDLAGNNYEGITIYDFTTAPAPDITPPTLTSHSPADSATSVPVTSNIALTFSETIQNGTGFIAIHAGSAFGTIIESFDVVTSNRLLLSGSVLTIDPIANLANNIHYFVTFDAGCVKDLAGNNYDSSSVYDFTTIKNSLTGTLGKDNLVGTNGDDILNALAGNDTVNGGLGADQMIGGLGNDIYYVDNIDDVVTETSILLKEIDIVYSAITYTLSVNLEKLILTGAAFINGIGNGIANTLVGNAGNNILTGGAGADVLIGGGGNDTYVVAIKATGLLEDTVTGNTGIDTIQVVGNSANTTVAILKVAPIIENLDISGTGTSKLNLTGNALANMLTGNEGNNLLNGGIGADSLIGGAGNDSYTVDNANDVVTEKTAEGIDLINSSVSYQLSANVENLTLTGKTAINASGNTDNNLLTGNAGMNSLSGNEGIDTLLGLAGNDSLNGGNGNDLLRGGAGNDRLTGGEGVDTFWFDTATNAKTNKDTPRRNRSKLLDFGISI